MPLLLVHGWPGSIVEFLGLIPRVAERFDIVAPSLPGYTLSFAPGQKRFGVEDIATAFVTRYEREDSVLRETVKFVRRLAQEAGYQVEEKTISRQSLARIASSRFHVKWTLAR